MQLRLQKLLGGVRSHSARSLVRQCAQIANSNQVTISDRAHVSVPQGNKRLSLARRENKLDIKTLRSVNVDNCPQIAAAPAMLGQVPIQDDCVEQVKHGYLGCAVMK
jgi:hypothetical protein